MTSWFMDGLAQSEYEHHTVSGLQGPGVNLTYRWVAQHTAPCPLAGVVGCVLPTCAQGLVEPGSRGVGEGENNWTSFWWLVLLLLILVTALLVSTWIHIRREHRHSDQRPSRSAVYFPSRGSCPLGWGTACWFTCRDAANLLGKCLFIYFFFLKKKTLLFEKGMVLFIYALLSMPEAHWEPTLCYRDAYSVDTPRWGKGLANALQDHVFFLFGRFFLVSKRTFFFVFFLMFHIE